jgi:hypothetical protein
VDATNKRLNYNGRNTDNDPKTRNFGRTRRTDILIDYNLRAGDLALTAGHEVLVHETQRTEHEGYMRDQEAGPTNFALWDQLPDRLRAFAPGWRVKLNR